MGRHLPRFAGLGLPSRREATHGIAIRTGCLLCLVGLLAPLSALAQDASTEAPAEDVASAEPAAAADPTEQARALFARGIACVEEHETACAVEAFREALALRDSPAIRYNLASALFDLRRYPEAARLTASVLGDEATPDEVRGPAEVLRDQLEAQGGTLAITVTGDATLAVVSVDGEPIPEAQRSAVIVAPGPRLVTATRGGAELARAEVSAVAGERAEVTLAIAPVELEAVAPLAPGPAPEVALHEDPIFWGVVAGSAAVAIAIIVIVAVATSGVEAPIEGNYEPGILRWD